MTFPMNPAPHDPRRAIRWLVIGVVLLTGLDAIVRAAIEVLWFSELDALSVLTTRWGSEFVLGAAGFVLAFAVLLGNALLTLRGSRGPRLGVHGAILPARALQHRMVVLGALGLALLFGAALSARWLDVRLWLAHAPYGQQDPIFGRDIGDYIFALPVWRLCVGWLLGLLAACFATTLLVTVSSSGPAGRPLDVRALRHLAILGALLALLVAARFALATYGVLYTQHRGLYGAGYTDVHARLPVLRALSVGALAVAVAMVIGAWRRRLRWVWGGPVLLAILAVLGLGLWPAAMQKLLVEPNELVKEKPYIENAIHWTRAAYDLESIQPRRYELVQKPDAAAFVAQRDLVENIRLWDWRPLLATYGQIQEIRLYYNFGDVDIDRYHIGGQYRQVMLSARELSYEQLPEGARTWVNLHLKYTHGYGLCMSPVNRITPEGLPELLIRDIPPASVPGLEVTRPEIYFGEQTSAFALVGTSTDEFDYPLGETNQATRYAGHGGIAVGSWGRRLLFAWYLRSRELLFTNYITPQSRILLRRSLSERAPRIAPFLLYDGDPYVVVSDGRLYWIQDAYTATDRFPYAAPRGTLNYVRNSVKIVVDAYEGTTRFYSTRSDEPLQQAYAKVFPELFHPLAELPAGLRAHLRYPEDLFQIQAEVFATYHMTDPQVFYNREDLWAMPVESVGGSEREVEPYYTLMHMPDGEVPEMILMLPFTPSRKDNMIAWLAAGCDGERLGERQVYLFPKQELIYGPRQIEARIDQDPAISQQLTLWSQHGSSVMRGNLLVIPAAKSVLYVEPLYLQAEKGALPELKRVIVALGDHIEMGPDLETTLAQLVGRGGPAAAASGPPEAGAMPTAAGFQAARQALVMLRNAEAAAQRGDWAAYGAALQELRRALEGAVQQADASRR